MVISQGILMVINIIQIKDSDWNCWEVRRHTETVAWTFLFSKIDFDGVS